MANTYKTMNKFLRAFFESNLSEFPWSSQVKTFSENLWGYVPDVSRGAVFVYDFDCISSNLLYSLEWHLIVLYITLFAYIDFAASSSITAAIIIWAIDLVVRYTRKQFGESNLAEKSLLDRKFLI